jgi:MFS family permease
MSDPSSSARSDQQMATTIAPIAALLLSVGVLMLGNGLQATFLPIRGNIEGFSGLELGLLGSAYFGGFVLGCVLVPHVVRRVGHIRTFVALTAVASAAPLVHVLVLDSTAWMILRGLTGFCLAGLYMVIESWLNERSTAENRGRVLSIYNMVNLGAIALGQLLLNLYAPESFALFCVAAILVSLAAVPVSVTTAAQPAPITTVRLRIRRLYEVSPVGVVGCVAVGMANSTFWALGPIFAQDAGFDVAAISIMMSIAIVGGAAAQWPIGFFSDRGDRRVVIVSVAGLAAIAGGGLVVSRVLSQAGFEFAGPALIAAGFLFGAFAMPLYAVCIAHVNDFISAEDFTETASGLLLVYGLAAVVGPALASVVIEIAGSTWIFTYTATIHVALVVFVLYRIRRRAFEPLPAHDTFVATPRTTPAVLDIDPRAPEMQSPDVLYEEDAADAEAGFEASNSPRGDLGGKSDEEA